MNSLVIKDLNEIKMKSYITIVFLLLISLSINAFGQAQKNADRQKKLSFTVNSEKVESKTKNKGDLFNLIVSADRKSIKKVERVYLRIIDPKTEENLLVKAIDKKELNGKKSKTDKTFKTKKMNKDNVLLNFGPFEKGEYDVYIKIKDGKDNVYFDRQKITL